MNPDNAYQPTPRPEVQPMEPAYGAPSPTQYSGSTPLPQPALQQPVLQATPTTEPAFSPTSTPLPRPIPLSAATIQNNTQLSGSNEQYSVDYLNQIAPSQKKSTSRFAVFAPIGGIILVALAAVIIFANAGPPDFSTQAKSAQSRIITLQTVADGQQTHLKENTISEANSSLASALTSMNTELTAIMKTKGIRVADSTKVAVSKTEKAYAENLTKKLDDSYQRGTLDRTYASQMTYELTVLRSTLNRMKNTANSKSVTTYVNSAVTNIDAILKAYNAFSATK